jgi:phosphoribosyl-dephospho-CoA transferase
MLEPVVHSLLRIATWKALSWEDAGLDEAAAPDWVDSALQRLPFVVVRRNSPRPGYVPVGIRGSLRSQRAPAWLQLSAVQACVTPRMLAAQRDWRHRSSVNSPAIAVLDEVEAILAAHGFGESWGPGGSVGAELASGVECTHAQSDLDLLLYTDCLLSQRTLQSLHAQFQALPVRVDTLIETPQGGVALVDLAGGADRVLLRTAQGPRLV